MRSMCATLQRCCSRYLCYGFSANSSTWLPLNPNYWWLNVAAQEDAAFSHLKVFRAMSEARSDPVLQNGDLNVLAPDNDTLVVVRCLNHSYYVYVANVGSEVRTYTSQNLFSEYSLYMNLEFVTGSTSFSDQTDRISLKAYSINISLRPKAAVLLRSTTAPPTPSAATLNTYLTIYLISLIVLNAFI